MKTSKSWLTNIKTSIFTFGLLIALSTPALALDFQFSFQNTGGNAGSASDVITGRILGLNEGANFQNVGVILDSVTPSLDPAFTSPLPYSWNSAIIATVTGGVLNSVSFSASDGIYAISLNTSYFSLAGFNKYYLGTVHFTPITTSGIPAVPDGGTSLLLLGMSMTAIGWMRRKMS